MVPKNQLYMYYKKGGVGDETKADDRLEECDNVDSAVVAFARIFQELIGNEFEPWETEKKFAKKRLKFHPIDMDDGIDMRYGGLGLRQLGIAVAHCKLQPRYATMEIGLDSPGLPMGMLSNFHLRRCEEELLQFLERVKSMVESGQRAHVVWSDFSQRWFTLLPSTRPFIFFDYKELADHAAAALETVRDIRVASHLVGDMTGPTIDDPLFDRYMKLGCSIQPVEKGSDDYRMIHAYLEKTYELIKVGDIHYGVSVQNIFAVDSSASPPYDEINKLPNKVLLWCGTRSSNLMRHLHKGFLPAICYLPVPGYMFGKAIVCSDAATEAAAYGFTAVYRPEGFLCLAVVSLGDKITELSTPPKDAEPLEKEKQGVKGLGRKKPDESEHFTWKDDIKVPSGKLVPSGVESPLKYNEFAVYDRKR